MGDGRSPGAVISRCYLNAFWISESILLLWVSTPNCAVLFRSKTLYYDVQPFLYYVMVRKTYKGVMILAPNTTPTDNQ
jgi:hypothetical protein